MAEHTLTADEVAVLRGTTDTDTDFTYAVAAENFVDSGPRRDAKMLELTKPVQPLRVYKDDSGALTFGVKAGKFFNGQTLVEYGGATAQALTDEQTNYIYLTADGTLTVNTTGFPAQATTPHIPLATVVCADGGFAYSDITDCRGRAMVQIPSTDAEAAAFFAATDMTGAEAEQLSDGSNADSLHKHFTTEADTHGSGSPNVLTAAESLKVLTNEGITEKNYHSLPAAAAGLQFTFIVQDSDGIRITAAAGDTIRVGDKVTIAAGYIESTTIGNVVTLVAVNATEWTAITVVGDWDVETS